MSILGVFGAHAKPRFNEKPQVRGREWSATLLFCVQGHLSKTTGLHFTGFNAPGSSLASWRSQLLRWGFASGGIGPTARFAQ